MKRSLVLSVALSAALSAAGYKIPENSINATALSAAYVANVHGADAAYYNPAAMVYNDDANLLEVDATYIGLSGIDFSGSTGNYSSKKEDFLVPTLHFSSKKLGDSGARVGFSIVAPAGLSKRWDYPAAKASAKEFTLKTIEVNPSFAVPISDSVSFGAGLRIVRSDGVVKSDTGTPSYISRNLEGDSIDIGYNIALVYKPLKELSLAATYRSKVNLTVEGEADLNYLPSIHPAHAAYSGSASVAVPIPAALNLAAAYTFDTGTTIEAVFERTYWSAYKTLDFDYDGTMNAATVAFGTPIAKNWEDTNTYRLGITQKIDQWTAMAGLAYDQTPVPEATLGYELPDADALIVSLGGRYKMDEHWDIGLAGLIDMKKDRSVHNSSINGEFTNARAYLVTAGIGYRF
ncbi:membrane protein involved in aromatic hydrocarbon degradation [Sulfuricurvum kujiense DSM 16994]|uniref:Membrane protein involved in aromatic hydrocarbon degradation n=1 Tax=Sulfuricurvum kujiense (strain ATCC BAA-921 / DSM 16994 / JCM 11577 / YK-1) TaxID=709032 RepID=E4TY14_SULKY|nr:outer membrane protein transport protein [Sulfuricurvum kujiense]ADR32927.1 membrane protein involved in aromatic hydrocarbon degradation [Sulfuricurvum kujiense DSM 16994]